MNALPEAAIRRSRFDFFAITALSLAITACGEDTSTNDTVQHNVLGRKIAANWWTLFRSDAHA